MYKHPRMAEVLEAFTLLLNDSMALDYCGITGKDRKLILNDPEFIRESRRLKAEKYIEEIKDINGIIKSLGKTKGGDNERIGESDEDPTKIISLKMKVTAMRREMLSLSSSDKEADESDSLNIFFIDVTREEFEKLMNTEIHEGSSFANLTSDESKELPIESAAKAKEDGKKKASIPAELVRNTIEYVNEEGDTIIEEVCM